MDRRTIVRIVALSIAVATLAVGLLFVVAPRFMEPIALDWRIVADLPLPMAAVGLLVALVWIHRITGLDGDPGPSIFRDRDERGPVLAELCDLTLGLSLPIPSRPVPSPIRRRLTVRWLVTRLEFAIASLGTAIVAAAWLVRPSTTVMSAGPDMPVAVAATAGCLVGLAWMIRIAREPAETGPSIWRSEHD